MSYRLKQKYKTAGDYPVDIYFLPNHWQQLLSKQAA